MSGVSYAFGVGSISPLKHVRSSAVSVCSLRTVYMLLLSIATLALGAVRSLPDLVYTPNPVVDDAVPRAPFPRASDKRKVWLGRVLSTCVGVVGMTTLWAGTSSLRPAGHSRFFEVLDIPRASFGDG
jgi:hypothetical protein